jgi:hypothetical protein
LSGQGYDVGIGGSGETVAWGKPENDDVAVVTADVGTLAFVGIDENHPTGVTNVPFAGMFEEMKVSAVDYVIADSTATRGKGHISALAFASKEEEAIVGPLVLVTVGLAHGIREEQDNWVGSRCADCSFALAAE